MEIKIPFYNILNMFLTGLIFIGCCLLIFSQYFASVFSSSLINNLGTGFETIIIISFFAVAYEVGLIINRIGSIIVEPFLKITKLIQFNNDYCLYNQARDKYTIFPTLTREYAVSRTSIAMFLILSVISAIVKNWVYLAFFGSFVMIFYFSCAKHARKVATLVDAQKEDKSNGKADENT